MIRRYGHTIITVALILLCSALAPHIALAQQLPGSADPGRAQTERPAIDPVKSDDAQTQPLAPAVPLIAPPEGAEELSFALKAVEITGMSVFDRQDFTYLYQERLNKTTSATLLWEIAGAITQRYHDRGYTFSRAYVPAQTVDGGIIRIAVIEGYIGDVELDPDYKDKVIIQNIIQDLMAQKPLHATDLESALLRLDNFYGVEFSASIAKAPNGEDGAIVLKLSAEEDKDIQGLLSSNNYGSRFVGPYRTGVTLTKSFRNFQQTTVSFQSTAPDTKELLLGSLGHRIQITPSVELDFLMSKTKSKPGFTLQENEIESDSFSWGVGAQWKAIRQRNKNLTLSWRFDFLNSKTDTFGTALTRDRVRAARASISYDFKDKFKGLNLITATISRGLSIFGGSKEGDLNLSRADANPDFTKLEAFYNRQDFLTDTLLLSSSLYGQWASSPLFSSEEFGYGGNGLGRAYDNSEITGDHGIGGALELNYLGLEPINGYKINPYIFYDIGKVWNKGAAATGSISAASAGIGSRIYAKNNLTLETMLAFPLTKSIDTPIQGGNGKNPVFRFGLTYDF